MASSDSLGAALFETVQTSLLAAAEIGGNRLLKYDDDALAGCGEMQGRCIAIDVTDLDFQLYCHPGVWGIRLSRNPPPREIDATISGRLMALFNLATEEDKLSTSMRERVSFHGDVGLAQRLQRLLAGLDIDWEEALAERTGDLFAFQLNQGLKRLGERFLHDTQSLLQTSSEFLREEARLTPTRVEFDRFQSSVGELKSDVARCEARLLYLLDKTPVP